MSLRQSFPIVSIINGPHGDMPNWDRQGLDGIRKAYLELESLYNLSKT